MADRRSRPYHNRGWHGGRGGRGGYQSGGGRQQWRGYLEAGMRGFVCTCNNREKECVREAMNLLSEYADILFGKEDWRSPDAVQPESDKTASETPEGEKVETAVDKEEEQEEEEDIADALKKEVQDLQAQASTKRTQQRFRTLNSGAKNYVFISSNVADPALLVHRLLSDLKASQQQRCRFLLRMLPVEATCRTNLQDITQTASKLFDKYFKEGGKSFSVVYKCRNNSGINREVLIEALADLIKQKNVTNYADLGNPQLAVLVEIVRNICCLSVVSDYFQLAKYNVLEVAAPPKEKQKDVGDRPEPEGQESDEAETDAVDKSDIQESEPDKSAESADVTVPPASAKEPAQDDPK